jgi:3-phosphoshikimate 1-carboxyvinyltransferase
MTKISITPTENISGEVEIPSSKSYTNRALIIASLIEGEVKIINPLISDDTKVMIGCLKELGIEIKESSGEIRVIGDVGKIRQREYKLNAGLSGTTIRFLLALCCVIPGIKIIQGEESLNKRPIGELAGALKDLGAKIEYLEKSGYPPLRITSDKLTSDYTRLHGDISSQFFSALLMIAPLVGKLEIDVIGNQISKPYIDMTIDLMKYFGVKVVNENYKKYIIESGQKYLKKNYTVEADYSSAGYFLAIAVLKKAQLKLRNLTPDSKQADRNFIKILENFGSTIKFEGTDLVISGTGLKPVNIDMENCPDQVQTMAVILAFAKGKSVITGVRSLRIKETERVLALQNELSKMGIKTESTIDTLTIYGGSPRGAEIDTYNDHRMAMAFAVAGTEINGVIINIPEVVTKTFPQFWERLRSIGVDIHEH